MLNKFNTHLLENISEDKNLTTEIQEWIKLANELFLKILSLLKDNTWKNLLTIIKTENSFYTYNKKWEITLIDEFYFKLNWKIKYNYNIKEENTKYDLAIIIPLFLLDRYYKWILKLSTISNYCTNNKMWTFNVKDYLIDLQTINFYSEIEINSIQILYEEYAEKIERI